MNYDPVASHIVEKNPEVQIEAVLTIPETNCELTDLFTPRRSPSENLIMWGFHSGDHEECHLLGYGAV
jgi:hypothetical protein